jgi:ClpX C4-type zinc finger
VIEDGLAVAVCRACVGRQLAGPVRATGEFLIPPEPADEPGPTPAPGAEVTACAWCGAPGDQVRKLLGKGAVAICDGCVALAVDILTAELGPSWRG